MERIVRHQTPVEFFKELVEKAMAKQKIASSQLSSFYLVNLLDTFVRRQGPDAQAGVEEDQPLAYLLCQAATSEGNRQLALFKTAGDRSLFVSGFFSDSLNRKLVDVDYYASLGGYAYAALARLCAQATTAALFGELSAKFVRFVDVLNEVSEASALTNNLSLLRLYEKWLRTGSQRSAAMLRELGVLPVAGSKRLQ